MANGVRDTPKWHFHHEAFKNIIGPTPSIELVLQVDGFPFAHEAGVFISQDNQLFVTSNQFKDHAGKPKVQISKISLPGDSKPAILEEIDCDLIHMANGGVNHKDGVLFCAQGSADRPSGLFYMQSSPPYTTEPVLTSYLGRPFNSVNDVVTHGDGSIWFTDPSYGHDQGYRPRPSLPNMIYRYDPANKDIRAMADGLGRPNGLCFSPDSTTLYVTDTDQVRGSCVDYSQAASM